jgi:uncharacterized protein involved in tolerance to divalent cations
MAIVVMALRVADFQATGLAFPARGENRKEEARADGAMVLVYCPCPSLEEAKRLGRALLESKLAGCINISDRMVSLYDWQGEREEAQEAVLVAKTASTKADRLRGLLERAPIRGARDPGASPGGYE